GATLPAACERRYVAAANFYTAAFAAEPKLANNNRYNAACAAALAASGEGNDAEELDDAERTRLRRQALDWLAAEFAAWKKLADKPTEHQKIRQKMQHWKTDTDFACVRDAAALAKLPEAERAAWQKLWADVAALQKR